MIGAIIGGALISTAGSLIGGSKAAGAAREQANLQNDAPERQLEYDTEAWEMKKDQLLAQRDYLVQEIELKAEQEGKLAAFRDATNLRQYNYDLQIRNRQQASNQQQFQRSNQIYADQLTLNEQAKQDAAIAAAEKAMKDAPAVRTIKSKASGLVPAKKPAAKKSGKAGRIVGISKDENEFIQEVLHMIADDPELGASNPNYVKIQSRYNK